MNETVRVTVPCSTSNLGAGFDCIGLAFDRHLTATLRPGASGLQLERSGTLAELHDDANDIVARVLRDQLPDVAGILELESTIPVGKGLGSSAAASVAALALSATLRDRDFDFDDALQAATALEGHPDNAAPSLLGGLVGVVPHGTRVRAIQLYLSEEIAFVYAAPQALVSTRAARKALPEHVKHAAATRTVARVVALIEGLAEADPDLLRAGFNDELHVPYRIGMIPGGQAALSAAMESGAWAATISGSGSGLIAVCEHRVKESVLAAMAGAFESATGHSAIAFIANPDFIGTRVERVNG